jgi:hypothetical protein
MMVKGYHTGTLVVGSKNFDIITSKMDWLGLARLVPRSEIRIVAPVSTVAVVLLETRTGTSGRKLLMSHWHAPLQ